MLHKDVLMLDIDVDHWRNLQSLVLESAKAKRRIIVIHEDGEVEKLVHSEGRPVVGAVERVRDPRALADELYRQNQRDVDFVAVFERRAFDDYFGRFQATWSPDEDLDVFVARTYALLDEYPDGIATAPASARTTLGLQWRVGTSYAEVVAAVEKFIPPETSVVFGAFDEDTLWTSLVLSFDADRRIDVCTTLDPSLIARGCSREATAYDAVSQVESRYRRCSLAMFSSVAGVRAFLGQADKAAIFSELAEKGDLVTPRVPPTLTHLLQS